MAQKPSVDREPVTGNPELMKLQVFISYASEDAVLAQAINAELKTAFSPAIIKTTLDSELKLGADWRKRLEEELSEADVLLIVATGRQKFSHSYTGFEVGFFTASKREREKMKHFRSDRLIIPIGILEKLPEALSDIESLNLKGALTPFLVDEDTLKNKKKFMDSMDADAKNNPLLRLFMRLKDVVQTLHNFDDDYAEDFRKKARESANRLYLVFFDEFQKRVFTEKLPERKIIVRLPTNTVIEPTGDLPADTELEFTGGSFEVFKINPPPDRTISWSNFIAQIAHDDTTTSWTDIIKSLVITAKRGDFVENRRMLASADQKRFFRLFVSRSVVYYSGITELHIYVVEVKSRDYGDPTTTMLLKAISVGLMYRFLFLERDSQFSPQTMEATLPRHLRAAVSELIQELDYLLWMSEDAGLSKPANMLLIYGQFRRGELETRFRGWETLKADLYSNALQVLRASTEEQLEAAKASFVDSLTVFCASTVEMNREFIGNVLRLLQEVVQSADTSLPDIKSDAAPKRVAVE